MIITIDVPPEMEPDLREKAARAGQDVGEWLLELARRETLSLPPRPRLTQEEFDRISDELAEMVGPDVPNWTDEDWSRESVYGDRA